jgi:predicted SAM-dependent methyltransferase
MKPPVLDKPDITPKVKTPIPETGVRLNLGGIGDDNNLRILPGFLVVDLQDHPQVDIQADISDLSMFKDGTVDEIYASNCLEHFRHTDTVKVLTEWHRVLKPGSTCWISVPDMDANFRLFQRNGMTPWLINIIWGDQVHPYAFHYINFTFGSLAKACYDAGFKDIQKLKFMPFGLRDASAHLDNHKHEPISLNVKAIA